MRRSVVVAVILFTLLALLGVVYLAMKAGGTSSTDAYKALGIVGAWIVLGVVWVMANPRMRGVKVFHHPEQPEPPPSAAPPPPEPLEA